MKLVKLYLLLYTLTAKALNLLLSFLKIGGLTPTRRSMAVRRVGASVNGWWTWAEDFGGSAGAGQFFTRLMVLMDHRLPCC